MKKRTHGWFARIMIQLFGMNPPVKNSDSNAGAGGVTTPAVVNNPQPSLAPSSNVADDFAEIKKFRNSADCSKWPVTVQISNVSFRGKNITWREAKGQREKRNWNVKEGDKDINGECILLIPSRGEAGMFDYLRVEQTDKITSNLYPGHEGPGFFAPWVPTKGERCGFCIATISRDKNHAKMKERSNVVWFNWP